MTAVYKYTWERKELFQPRDNVGVRTNGHEAAMNKARLEIRERLLAIGAMSSLLSRRGGKQVSGGHGVCLSCRRIFMAFLLRTASVSSAGGPSSPGWDAASRCSGKDEMK